MRTALETGDYYWREVLLAGGASEIPPPARPSMTGQCELVVDCGAQTTHALGRLVDATRVPIEAVLVAAHAKVLSEWCGGSVAVLGLRAPDMHTVLPLRVSTGGRTWHDLLRAADDALVDLMHHHSYPVALLCSDLDVRGPVFSTALRLGSTRTEPAIDVALCIDVDLASPHTLRLRHRLDASDASRVGRHHLRVLAAMAADPDAAHDADAAPEITVGRPRSAPMAARR